MKTTKKIAYPLTKLAFVLFVVFALVVFVASLIPPKQQQTTKRLLTPAEKYDSTLAVCQSKMARYRADSAFDSSTYMTLLYELSAELEKEAKLLGLCTHEFDFRQGYDHLAGTYQRELINQMEKDLLLYTKK
jgi:hypothetical protein